jgi:hypothetical protein
MWTRRVQGTLEVVGWLVVWKGRDGWTSNERCTE